MKYDESFYNILIHSGLAFKYLAKTLKSICQAPVRLIGKRGLICDHSQLFVYFWKIFVYFYKFRPRSIFGNLTSKNILLAFKGLKTLKSICRPPVSLIDERTLFCDHIKNPTHLVGKYSKINSIAKPV